MGLSNEAGEEYKAMEENEVQTADIACGLLYRRWFLGVVINRRTNYEHRHKGILKL